MITHRFDARLPECWSLGGRNAIKTSGVTMRHATQLEPKWCDIRVINSRGTESVILLEIPIDGIEAFAADLLKFKRWARPQADNAHIEAALAILEDRHAG